MYYLKSEIGCKLKNRKQASSEAGRGGERRRYASYPAAVLGNWKFNQAVLELFI